MSGPLWESLPTGWLGGQVRHLGNVTLGKMLQSRPTEDSVQLRYLRAANIQPDGELSLEDLNAMWFKPTEVEHLTLQRGDVVVVEGGQGGFGRAAHVAEDLSGVGFQNSINRVRPNSRSDGRFLAYYLIALRAAGYIRAFSNVVSMPHLTAEKLAALPAPIPPLPEQRAIADYLDRETAQIDTLIEEQQRLMRLAEERRRALRSALATGSVHPSKRRTGAAWLREVPADWGFVPITSVARLESGHTPSRSRPELWESCSIPWVSLHDVGRLRSTEYIEETVHRISELGMANSSARLLPAGTVVLSRDATVGRSGIMAVPMATSQHFAAWVCGERLLPRYLRLVLDSAMQPLFASFGNGSTLRTIGMGDIKTFRIPLPPVQEQKTIVESASRESAAADALIAASRGLIDLSRERRAALITAAVTGQIDIQEAA